MNNYLKIIHCGLKSIKSEVSICILIRDINIFTLLKSSVRLFGILLNLTYK
jgi:hypothetical protein